MGCGNGPWLARKTRVEGWPCGPFPTVFRDTPQMQIDQIGDQLQDVLHGVDNAPALDRR
jgi:hypothetical protein